MADLMYAAYAGTTDDDGETMDDAIVEVRNFYSGEYGTPLPEPSQVAHDADGRPVAAVLITRWGRQNLPLIAFVMTAPAWKRKGLGRALCELSLAALAAAHEPEVRAVITDGNIPSERLFHGLGFTTIGSC